MVLLFRDIFFFFGIGTIDDEDQDSRGCVHAKEEHVAHVCVCVCVCVSHSDASLLVCQNDMQFTSRPAPIWGWGMGGH